MGFITKNVFVKSRLVALLMLLGIDSYLFYFNNPLVVCDRTRDVFYCYHKSIPFVGEFLPLSQNLVLVGILLPLVLMIIVALYYAYRICLNMCHKLGIERESANNIILNFLIFILALLGFVLHYVEFIKVLPYHQNGGGEISLSYPVEFSDNKNLVGGASNIFVAKVIAQIGNKETSVGPRTQYSVEIVRNIKGDLSGNVTVDQLGGLESGHLSIVEDSTLEGYFLQPGSTYLLSTRYDEKESWYTLNPHPNASKLLTSDMTASIGALKKLADIDPKTKELEAAYPNEQLIDADVAHGNTRNAFRDLPDEAKAAAQSRADEARVELEKNNGQ